MIFLAVYAARNQKIRDDWVKAMEARIIKEKLDECYRTEGVNHCKLSPHSHKLLFCTDSFCLDQSCRHLADMYFETIKNNRVEGFRKSS